MRASHHNSHSFLHLIMICIKPPDLYVCLYVSRLLAYCFTAVQDLAQSSRSSICCYPAICLSDRRKLQNPQSGGRYFWQQIRKNDSRMQLNQRAWCIVTAIQIKIGVKQQNFNGILFYYAVSFVNSCLTTILSCFK
jgi:hypothetical protein